MIESNELQEVLNTTRASIDTLYAGRRVDIRLEDLDEGFLRTVRFDLNLISQVIEKELNRRSHG